MVHSSNNEQNGLDLPLLPPLPRVILNPLTLAKLLQARQIPSTENPGVLLQQVCLQCFDTVGWAAGRASGL